MVNREGIRTVVGVVGNVISFGLFAAPVPTFWRIVKKGSVEEFSPVPYVCTVMNCLFWIFYGIPLVHPDSTLVVTINSIGLVLELIYLAIFLVNGKGTGKRKWVFLGLFVEVVVLAATAVGTLMGFHTHHDRSMFVGIFCIVFGVIMYASPLSIMKKVIKTKSVEYMPFCLSLTSFLNGVCWLLYALLKFDLYILISNGLGAVLGAAQLILYGCYWKRTDEKASDVKPSEVQLPDV